MSKKVTGPNTKFAFGIEFQEAILNFLISDGKGYKVIDLVDDSYFAVINHAIIFKAVKAFWKRKKRIPSIAVLKEELRKLYSTRDFYKAIQEEDKKEIEMILDKAYNNRVLDSDEILMSIIKFARYANLKSLQENHDLEDFDSYDDFAKKVQVAINTGHELDEDIGMFVVKGARDRLHQRQMGHEVKTTPWWQFNRLFNGGGTEKHALIMIMAEQKRFKTGIMVNWARNDLGRKKVGFYVDLENGQMAIATRTDQSIMKIDKKSLIEGREDDRLLKTYRKYARIKSELVIKRFPAYKTTTNHIQAWLDKLRLQHGLKFDYGIVDYGDLLAATTGRVEDDKRISDAYIDLKNLAEENNLDYILTASHVKRDKDTLKRRSTKYISADVAKAIDKTRHADVILGLQETDEEKEAGVMRIEIVDQRDGQADGHCLFWTDIEKQLAREFTREEVKEYWKQTGREDDGKKKKAEKNSDI